MKKVMIVCGGPWQEDLVRTARQQGHFVINTNLHKNSPAFSYANAYEIADVLDKEKNLSIAKKYKPDAVITDQSDIAVPTVAYINEQLGLPGIGSHVAQIFTNKQLMREICRQHGFPTPAFMCCETFLQVEDFFIKHKDIVLKPLSNQSSRGVTRVTEIKDLKNEYKNTLLHSNGQKNILVEQFMKGTEFSVEGIKYPRYPHISLAVSEKTHYKKAPMVASSLYYSHSNELFDYNRLKQLNDHLVDVMGLPFGLTHAEYICSNGTYYLVEIAARGGGTNISSRITPFMSKMPIYQQFIQMSLGENVYPNNKQLDERYNNHECILGFFDFPQGKSRSLLGEQYLANNKAVLDWKFNFSQGEFIPKLTDDSTRPGHYIIGGKSNIELKEFLRQLKEEVRVVYDEGD